MLLTLAGCTGYDFRVVVPESTKEVNKVVADIVPKPVDILFVVDNSGSMADEQELLAASFQSFIDVLSANPKNDYKLAVITTDAGDIGFPRTEAPDELEFEGVVTNQYSGAPYFDFSASDVTFACMRQLAGVPHGCFRGPDPTKRVITSAMTPAEQVAAFQANVKVGSCGSGTEQGLITPVIALGRPCNAGFIRPEANLVIVLVSDEEDSSPSSRNYVREILAAAGKTASQLRVATIVGSADGRASWCNKSGVECGHSVCDEGQPDVMTNRNANALWTAPAIDNTACRSCSYFNAPDCCSAQPGGRYVQFAQDVEDAVRAADPTIADRDCRGVQGDRVACLVDTICQDNFSATLERIARDLVAPGDFELKPAAKYPPGVVLELNGERLKNCAGGDPCDFAVTPDGSQVSIRNAAKVPGEMDTLSIYFVVEE